MINSKIKSIVVTYSDEQTEKFSSLLLDKLSLYKGSRETLSEFIFELLDFLNIKKVEENLQSKFEEQSQKQTEIHKKEVIRAVKSSAATIKGQTSEKWFPFMFNYPYNNGDVISANDPMDYIVLVGLNELHITKRNYPLTARSDSNSIILQRGGDTE